jgi:hypothetical protein
MCTFSVSLANLCENLKIRVFFNFNIIFRNIGALHVSTDMIMKTDARDMQEEITQRYKRTATHGHTNQGILWYCIQ